MRFNEFEKSAKRNVAERAEISEEQLDEIIPAIAGIARAGATLGAKAAGGIAKAGAKVGAAAAKKVGAAAVKGAQGVGKGIAKKVAAKNAQALAKAVLKKGQSLPMPTDGGKTADFKIDDLKGDEVTLTNPKPKPGEPIKTVHKTKELDPIIQQMVQTQQ
ncbi:hypothetical protein N9D61_03855 [Planktomarina sp.]|jgi:hypothetical protein|nr:hypothetical protein [Planktomarina sp.]